MTNMIPLNAGVTLYRTGEQYKAIESSQNSAGGAAVVLPQASVCSPCIQVGGAGYCVTLLGRRICLPSFGRWKACCGTTWRPPFVSCGIRRC